MKTSEELVAEKTAKIAEALYNQRNTLKIWDRISPNVRFDYIEQAELFLKAVEDAGYSVTKIGK